MDEEKIKRGLIIDWASCSDIFDKKDKIQGAYLSVEQIEQRFRKGIIWSEIDLKKKVVELRKLLELKEKDYSDFPKDRIMYGQKMGIQEALLLLKEVFGDG